MREEVKDAALRQLAEGGPSALSLNAIAKDLGVSGPALYRYFASRDALLTELVLDAYADLAEALRAAPTDARAVAVAYRSWALGQPHRYRLLFAAPLPGYDAHDDRLVAASQRSMDTLLAVLGAAGAQAATDADGNQAHVSGVGVGGAPMAAGAGSDEVPSALDLGSGQPMPELAEQFTVWAAKRGIAPVDPAVALRAVALWSRVHGFVSLEIEGNFASMSLDPELLFRNVLG